MNTKTFFSILFLVSGVGFLAFSAQAAVHLQFTLELATDLNGSIEVSQDGVFKTSCDSSNCQVTIQEASIVRLEAIGNEGFEFLSWGGACDGVTLSVCEITMFAPEQVSVQFKAREDVAPFSITDVQIVKVTQTKVRARWNTTRVADCSLVYADHQRFVDDTIFGGSLLKTILPVGDANTIDFDVLVDRDYYYVIVCRDFNTQDLLAKTDRKKIPRPSVEIHSVEYVRISPTSARISWQIEVDSHCRLVYNTEPVEDDAIIPGEGKTIVDVETNKEAILSNLKENTMYYYRVVCRDRISFDKLSESEMFNFTTRNEDETPVDHPAPIVTAISTDPSSHSAVIRWKTDMPASSQILYGLGPEFLDLNFSRRSDHLVTEHELVIEGLLPETVYYFKLEGANADGVFYSTEINRFKTLQDQPVIDPEQPKDEGEPLIPLDEPQERDLSAEEQKLRERIRLLEYRVSELESQLIETERRLVQSVDLNLVERLRGKILLQVEENGEAWYVDEVSSQKYYLRDGESAHAALQVFGLGITDLDLTHIPIGLDSRFEALDTDGDGLADKLEEALGSDPLRSDTDGDGFEDGEEIENGYSPLDTGQYAIDPALVSSLEGKILLQVESRGEAWYMHEGKRYYLGSGQQAYQIMRFLSLGITNEDLRKISVGDLQ